MSLQSSNYVIIEQDPKKLPNVKEFGEDKPLNLRYAKHVEAENKRKNLLIFKQKYLQKHQNLKLQG